MCWQIFASAISFICHSFTNIGIGCELIISQCYTKATALVKCNEIIAMHIFWTQVDLIVKAGLVTLCYPIVMKIAKNNGE